MMKMRTKSIRVRSSRKSLDPSNPSLAPLPDDEANENFCSGVISNTQCDTDVEIVPDTFDERDVPHKKRHCLGTSVTTDRGGSVEPLLDLDACIVCEVSDERVSRCCGVDCLLSFHGECLYAELGSSSSEDVANPFCPYCWFKIVALKSKTLREKTVEAEKAVFKYLDKEMKSRNGDTTLSGDAIGNQEQSTDKGDNSRGENTLLIEEIDQPGEDKGKVGTDKVIDKVGASEDEERVATENFQDAEDDDKDDETAKDQSTRILNTGAGKKGDVSSFLSMHESFSAKEHNHVQQNVVRRRRRQIELNTIDSEISSKGSSNERNGEDVTEQVTSSAQVTSPSGKMKNQQATTKVAAKPKTVRGISFFMKDQRRRLLWTYEEEEMLKVGVEKFAADAKKNMPWRKILEMGAKVFHETRTPADLKDKWRNMLGARVGPETNKAAH
ncbi:Homeobox-like domain superfamily [Arabidopsis suecica]|uniref:Homeobox-like domain superfamily n=1 Tax=Arabidopsis suecica TaxID=45249 RepID=A0A8T1Z549_ARASU|nr:Homeobox-like domain superfamily [Arabidopsis suecica]